MLQFYAVKNMFYSIKKSRKNLVDKMKVSTFALAKAEGATAPRGCWGGLKIFSAKNLVVK